MHAISAWIRTTLTLTLVINVSNFNAHICLHLAAIFMEPAEPA